MRALAVVVLVCLALVGVQPASVRRKELLKTTRYDLQRRPPPPVKSGSRLGAPKTHYFTQLLDHFDPTVDATWNQRYFSNPQLYAEGGPVFIFIEGESEADSGWIAEGGSYMYTMAEQFKAKQYVLEHRFFGESKPTKDISTENLKWLTSDQALADLAYFIEYLIKQGEVKKGQKIAVFGGSYPGNLAAWARLKYPHLIHAAVASSAPVHAEEDFPEYFEVVTRSMRRLGGDSCADNLKKGFDRLEKLLMTSDGPKKLQEMFYMCNPINATNKLDLDLFYYILASPYATATQYNRDNSYTEYSLKAQCQNYMAGDLTPDQVVANLAQQFVDSQGFIWSCVNWDYESNTEYLKSTEWDQGAREWLYMTCTMFGYFQTADGDTSFPKGYFDVPYYVQQCKDAFGDEYQDAMVKKGVERTNTVFGDWTPDVDNVMFVNGDIDPWHSLSVLKDVNPSSPAVLISGTSHCYDMYANDDSDSKELREAREKVKKFLLNVFYEGADSENPTIAS